MLADPNALYQRDGFYIHDQAVLSPEVVDPAVVGMDAVRGGEYDTGVPPRTSAWSPGDDETLLCKIEKPQIANRAIMELILDPALAALAAKVTGAKWIQVWWVQLLYKPSNAAGATNGVNVGWHQDRNYWGAWEEGSELFTAWVGLSEVGKDAGPMKFVEGSHRWGLLQGSDFFGQDLDGVKSEMSLPDGVGWKEASATMPKGGVSFHDCLTLHGSGANVSTGPRRSLAIHMRTDQSRPVDNKRAGLTAYIDGPDYCPVVWNKSNLYNK